MVWCRAVVQHLRATSVLPLAAGVGLRQTDGMLIPGGPRLSVITPSPDRGDAKRP